MPVPAPLHPEDTAREVVLPVASDPARRRRYAVLNEPIPGNLRFGVLLEDLDRLAAETALDYARRVAPDAYVVTAAVDEIVVRGIADVTTDVRCLAQLNRVGRSSMEVGMRVETAPAGLHVASCYFTMVAREGGADGARSVSVPALAPGGERARDREARAAQRREAARLEEQAALEPPSREEYLLLRGLHEAQEAPGFEGFRADALVTETWERTFPEQENTWKVIFGGFIMRRAYELAHISAERIASHRPVIAAVNRVNFLQPVQIGDKLHMSAGVVYTEGAAVCVAVRIERISRDRSARAVSNTCVFTFVNVDPALAPVPVQPVHPATYAEDARYLRARRLLASLSARSGGRWLGARR
jgi:acyl-coenzyme A thioesterase 9